MHVPGEIGHRLRLRLGLQSHAIQGRRLPHTAREVHAGAVGREVGTRRPGSDALRDLPRDTVSHVHQDDAVGIEDATCMLEDDVPSVRTPARVKRPRCAAGLKQRAGLSCVELVDAQLALAVFATDECQPAAIRGEHRIAREGAALRDLTGGTTTDRLLPQKPGTHDHEPLLVRRHRRTEHRANRS